MSACPLWQDDQLVFASAVGAQLDDHNVRRQFGVITEAAGLGTEWVPRVLRLVYRHQIVPASPTAQRGL